MKITLHVSIRSPDEGLREFELEFSKAEILIGRDGECDIQIPLHDVSRKHSKIIWDDQGWVLEDLGSASGTKLNGEPVSSKVKLGDCDLISISQANIIFNLYESSEGEDFEEKTSVLAQKMVQDIFSEKSDDNLPYFRVMNGREEGARVSIKPDSKEFLIGRDALADLCLVNAGISRKHARILRDWNGFCVENLNSKNGIVVNGLPVSGQTLLKDGDEIYLGVTHIVFHDPNVYGIGKLEALETFDLSQTKVLDEIEQEIRNSEITAPLRVPQYNIHPTKIVITPEIKSRVGLFETILFVFALMISGGLFYGFNQILN